MELIFIPEDKNSPPWEVCPNLPNSRNTIKLVKNIEETACIFVSTYIPGILVCIHWTTGEVSMVPPV